MYKSSRTIFNLVSLTKPLVNNYIRKLMCSVCIIYMDLSLLLSSVSLCVVNWGMTSGKYYKVKVII